MKPAFALLGGLCVVLMPTGCHRSLNTGAEAVTVVIEGGGRFPASLAGRWKADQHGWEILFTESGSIASAVISMGRVPVRPGQKATVPTRSGGQGVFDPGLWTVHYAPSTKQLTVRIVMDYVRVEMGGNTLEGKSTDVFAGTVSGAEGTWQAQWTTFTNYTATTPENVSFQLSTDPLYGEAKPLTFVKTDKK